MASRSLISVMPFMLRFQKLKIRFSSDKMVFMYELLGRVIVFNSDSKFSSNRHPGRGGLRGLIRPSNMLNSGASMSSIARVERKRKKLLDNRLGYLSTDTADKTNIKQKKLKGFINTPF